jgi:hypothetical protein
MSRALVISLQYSKFSFRLNGCFRDSDNFIKRLRNIDPSITIITMRDDLPQTSKFFPTTSNIVRELCNLCEARESKLFLYYSGHGTTAQDFNKDELTLTQTTEGKNIANIGSLLADSCLVTNEKNSVNILTDDRIGTILSTLSAEKTLYSFLDCCNSGTGLDLCWVTMGKFSSQFTSTTWTNLQKEMDQKCSIVQANYPDKVNNCKANIIAFSGTRDNSYSYEGSVNGQVSGFFTFMLCNLLDTDISTITLRQFYYSLIALLNNKKQIPVLSCSRNLSLDTVMSDFKLKTKNKTVLLTNAKIPTFRTLNWDTDQNASPVNMTGLYIACLHRQRNLHR